MGIPFDLAIDCAAFNQTNSKKYVPSEIVQWLMYLQGFILGEILRRSALTFSRVDERHANTCTDRRARRYQVCIL